MSTKSEKRGKKEESVQDLLKKLLIVQMGLAEVPQSEIRQIVGGDIYRVQRILKHLKKQKSQ